MQNNIHVVQIRSENGTVIAAQVKGEKLQLLSASLYDLALRAANEGRALSDVVEASATDEALNYNDMIEAGRLLSPITHPDPAHLLLTGTGLTHLGSAAPRHKMHGKEGEMSNSEEAITDTQRIFEWGVESGKPAGGGPGVQPEWFYKGTGHTLRAPYQDIQMPAFALDGGEEAELAGIYIVNAQGQVFRIGYALSNEFSDHVTEKQNYLYLAHSKLRDASIGPEIVIGKLPEEVRGNVSIHRNGSVVWQHDFASGEQHMCHSIENLEHHHFKYATFCVPGQLHVHFFGAAVLSFADAVKLQDGDEMRIECDLMTKPLINRIKVMPDESVGVTAL
ncbi:AraD1 family protein [Halomonas sp. AOP27-A1-41]|uniref:AraD1 family protein n=1 Tax=Halomonas sp. AOP27-A1-41 TaxID=3457707 RepID=UPI0040342BFB